MTLGAFGLASYDVSFRPAILMAYAFAIAGFVWSTGYWFTSDFLRSLNPARWNMKRRKNVSETHWRHYIVWKWFVCAAISVLFVCCIYCVHWADVQIRRRVLSDWIVPANDPMGVNQCGSSDPQAVTLYFGSNSSTALSFPHVLVRMKGKDMVSLERDSKNRLGISATFLDRNGKLIAKIENNYFSVNRNNYFTIDNPDDSTLVVRDESDNLLKIRFKNEREIVINSAFIYGPDGYGPFQITDNSAIFIPNGYVFQKSCVSGSNGDFSF